MPLLDLNNLSDVFVNRVVWRLVTQQVYVVNVFEAVEKYQLLENVNHDVYRFTLKYCDAVTDFSW